MNPAVFILAQGRTGSTFLWDSFNHVPGCVAYLEPLNPDLLRDHEPQTYARMRHRGVTDYWGTYRSLPQADLVNLWTAARRALKQPSDSVASPAREALLNYVAFLLEESGDRMPVLQFNRAWGHMRWLSDAFPDAHVIHLWRDMRAQWKSAKRLDMHGDMFGEVSGWLAHVKPEVVAMYPEFSPGRFAAVWAECWQYGHGLSDLSISYESIVAEPVGAFATILPTCGLEPEDAPRLAARVDVG